MDKNDWLEMADLTSEEINDLLTRVHDYMVSMEMKNTWDASINEVGFQDFLYQSFYAMLEEIKKDLNDDIEKYQWYPKINEFWHYADYISQVQCTVDEARGDFNREHIYETVEAWWKFWFNL